MYMLRFPFLNNRDFGLTKKILIGISLILSFGLTMLLGTILTPPFPRLENIITSVEKLKEYKINSLMPKLSLPKIFTQITLSTRKPLPTTNSQPSINYQPPVFNQQPTTIKYQPSVTSYQPTVTTSQPTITSYQPSVTPKPTKTPKPTPTPTFALTNPRPGKNFQEVADILQPIICIPSAMIMATLEKEYGPWLGNVQANWVNNNTYNGSDPNDVSGSTKVTGVMQMMEDTWHRIKPYVGQKLGTTELSLTVTFDSMAAGAYHLRNISLAMHDKISCDDWPVKYILYGACRYSGGCAPGATTYNQYAYDVCNYYNDFTKGPKKNCQ
jgi:hypothetical protein